MNIIETLEAGNTTSWKKFTLNARFVTILAAAYSIEIRPDGGAPFQVDDADEIDFGFEYEGGGNIYIRNVSDQQNAIIIAASSKYVRRKKSVELTADLSNINVASGTVGLDSDNNNVKVTNQVSLEPTQVLKIQEQSPLTDLSVNNFPVFPVSFQVSNFPEVYAPKKYTVITEKHAILAAEVAAGWTFNNGTAERLIIAANNDVTLNSDYYFASGVDLKLNDIAPNQDFIFKGLENDEISIIKMVAI